ncbi:MAG: hypothetical protein ACLQQ4_10650 [Bacteroidia bacterium]
MNPSELIEGCLHNDNIAQRCFYDTYSAKVMGICMRYSAGGKDTEVMALYVFKKLYEELIKCSADTDMNKWAEERAIWNAIAYLHQDKQRYFIAKTTNYFEKKSNNNGVADEAELSTEESGKIYIAALHSLTPSYRILFNLTYIDKISPDKIVQNLEIAGETHKVELEQARFQFKQQLITSLNENGLRNNNFEKKAHELLAPLTGICPGSIWDGVSIDLAARRARSEEKWLNKLGNAPKIPLIASGAVAVLTIAVWMFFIHPARHSGSFIAGAPVNNNPAQVSKAPVNNNNSAATAPVVIANDISTQNPAPDRVDNTPTKNTPVSVRNDNAVKKQVDTVSSRPAIEVSVSHKDDSAPMVIHTDNDGSSPVTAADMPGNKGVAIDLDKKDTAIESHDIASSLPQSVADTANSR